MELNTIVEIVNSRLAGENLIFSEMKFLMDSVIDDINHKLDSTFPAFSEFTNTTPGYPNYAFFPDKYLRSVVAVGTAAKFYQVDEEGVQAARDLEVEYQKNLFYMERDYTEQVPEAYQAANQGYVIEVARDSTTADEYADLSKMFDF